MAVGMGVAMVMQMLMIVGMGMVVLMGMIVGVGMGNTVVGVLMGVSMGMFMVVMATNVIVIQMHRENLLFFSIL